MMSTETLSSITSLIDMFNMQTRLFKNVTEGLSNEITTRPNESTNHMAWLIGHTVSTRYMLNNLLGGQEEEPYPNLFVHGKGLQPEESYPSLADLLKDWENISEKMINRLKQAPESKLAEGSPVQVAIEDPSLRGTIAFFVHHEAYTIGQLGILRKYFGHEAMKYN